MIYDILITKIENTLFVWLNTIGDYLVILDT